MKRLLASLAVFVVALLAARDARAQQFTLTVTPSSFVFATQDDPDTQPNCNGDILTIGYKAAGMGSKKNPASAWTLSVRATDDLRMADGTPIPITNVRWTASAPFNSGTQLTTTDQPLFNGTGNMVAIQYATVQFILSNSWTYKAGTYTTSIVFTLSQP